MLAGADNTYVVSALGGVGTGKSSLLNAITGEYTFETGDGTDVRNLLYKTFGLKTNLLLKGSNEDG